MGASLRSVLQGALCIALGCTDHSGRPHEGNDAGVDSAPIIRGQGDAEAHGNLEAEFDAGCGDAGCSDAGGDASVAHSTKLYKRVLLLGDSFVGLGDGLVTGLKPRFEAEGTDVRTVPWKAIKIIFFADDERVPELLKKWNPDLVVLVLGGNDMFVNEPEKHAAFVRKTARLMRGRDCYWLGPPPWKKSTGILDIIARDSAPCTFFDSRGLDIDRNPKDHIHPTNKGGETWAAAFWQFFRGHPGVGASASVTAR